MVRESIRAALVDAVRGMGVDGDMPDLKRVVELKRRLWQSIADAQVRPDGRAASDGHEEPRASA